jgi:hypothetical protein
MTDNVEAPAVICDNSIYNANVTPKSSHSVEGNSSALFPQVLWARDRLFWCETEIGKLRSTTAAPLKRFYFQLFASVCRPSRTFPYDLVARMLFLTPFSRHTRNHRQRPGAGNRQGECRSKWTEFRPQIANTPPFLVMFINV